MSIRNASFTIFTAFILCFAGALQGQIRSGTITGIVTDASGAVVPNADVIVTNQETDIKNATKTNGSGQFTVPYLPAGSYTVSVNLGGFHLIAKPELPWRRLKR